MVATESGAETSGRGRPYRCYLVRCRLEEGAGQANEVGPEGKPAGRPVWRFTVEQVRPDAARRSFASIHDVAAYIDAELASCSAGQDSHHSTHSEVKP